MLAWVYDRTGSSIPAVAAWHGTYNWAVVTEATDDAVAAIVAGLVIASALWIMRTVGPDPDREPTVTSG